MAQIPRRPRYIVRVGVWAVAGALIAGAIAFGALYGSRSLRLQSEQATLKVALPTFGAEVLDPSLDSAVGLQYHGHMFDHLVGATPDGRLSTEMGALQRWEMSPDAKSYRLTLRKGMKWHDGVEITSADVDFSLAHYSREGATCGACPTVQATLKSVEIEDRYTVELRIDRPNVEFMSNFGAVEGDMPLLPGRRGAKGGDVGVVETPLGSGPWKYVKRSIGQSIEYEANRDYWNPDRVPDFDRLRLFQVPDAATRVALLRSGEVDMTILRPAGAAFDQELAQTDLDPLKAEGFKIDGPKYITNTVLRFLMSYDPAYLTSRLEFRKSLILAMDLESIVGAFYAPEVATLRTGFPMTSPATEGYDAAVPAYPYDPEAARALLRESGYNGETVRLLSIAAYGLTEVRALNELLAEEWRKIGVNVDIIQTEYSQLEAKFYPRPQEFEDVAPAPLFHGVDYRPQPGYLSLIDRYMTSNKGSMMAYHDPERGDRIYAELSAIVDPEARQQRLHDLYQALYDEYWAAPIVWRHDVYALSPELSGWAPTNGTPNDLHLETIRRDGR